MLETFTPIFHGSYKLGELIKFENNKTILLSLDFVKLCCQKRFNFQDWGDQGEAKE